MMEMALLTGLLPQGYLYSTGLAAISIPYRAAQFNLPPAYF